MLRTDAVFGPGLGQSQKTILELLMRSGAATLADLEASLELAAETLRDHLKSLAAKGLVERAGVRRDGPGRPHVIYRLTDAGADLFPRREGELLRELATFLVESGRDGLLEEFFTARAERRRAALHRRVAGLEGIERLGEVAQILSEEGFLAEVAASESGPCIRLCHCPVRDLVAVSQLPCQAEMDLIAELLGGALNRVSFMPNGDPSCTYSIGRGKTANEELDAPDSPPTN